ncbi:Nuclear autoantigenic sperm protein [Nymphon striatum]|nr:Nuclear autoantigenic sperm protein [Nymphon striatum]
MAATASSSASTSKSDSIDISEAVNHFSQGKRHLLVQDYPSAVSSLQSATEIFAEKYGEMANECGDAYFQYGKALLELARMETGVLGNALDGVPEDSEDSEESNSNKDQVESPNNLSVDEQEKIAEEVDRALEETSRELDAKFAQWKSQEISKVSSDGSENTFTGKFTKLSVGKENTFSNDEKLNDSGTGFEKFKSEICEVTKISDSQNEPNSVKSNVKLDKIENDVSKCGNAELEKELCEDDDDDDEAEAEAEDKEEEEEDDEKEVTIDKSPENKKGDEENDGNEAENDEDKEEMKLKMADTYLKLGEIAIESGNYQAAEEDLTKCLKIRQNDLEPDDRLIAETHFQLGVAFSFNSEFDKGRSSYEEATKVIKQRISNLENKLKDITDQDQKETLQLEITDLKELIPEINSKVEDTEDMKRNAAKAREEAIKEAISQQKVMFGTEDASTSKDPFADSGFTSSSSLKNGPFIAASPTKPVSNIGHLVRKKRKTDDESSETGSPLKKVCSSTENIISSENNINGTATSYPNHKEEMSQFNTLGEVDTLFNGIH